MIDVLHIDGVVLNLEVIELILGLFNLIAQGISALRQLLAGGERRTQIAVIKRIDDLADLIIVAVRHDGLVQAVEPGVELVVG